MSDVIEIRAKSKGNTLTFAFGGAGLILVGWIMTGVFPQQLFLPGVLLMCLGLVGVIVSWYKAREPGFSLLIGKDQIHYHHRVGKWQLSWDNIQRIDVPRSERAGEWQDLDMLGIRLKDYTPVLNSFSPRLISHMLLEQRALLLHNDDCSSGQCYSIGMIEDDQYKDPQGKVWKGLQAMLANRMQRLRKQLGYDLYINAAELDRPVADFVVLLKQCQEQITRYQPQSESASQ